MSIIRVPMDVPTIQAAIDLSLNGDEILISPGVYLENLRILGKSDLKLKAIADGVMVTNQQQIGIGLCISSNQIKVEGISFCNFCEGIIINGDQNSICSCNVSQIVNNGIYTKGNNNSFNDVSIKFVGTTGIELLGNYTSIQYCNITDCPGTGIQIKRNNTCYVMIANNYIRSCNIGINCAYTKGSNNVQIKCNIISTCAIGIVCRINKTNITGNTIASCQSLGAFITGCYTSFCDNTLLSDNGGIFVNANNCDITKNTIQNGTFDGILLTGDNNRIAKNIVYGYEGVGLLINGDSNLSKENVLKCNKTNSIESGCKNIVDMCGVLNS